MNREKFLKKSVDFLDMTVFLKLLDYVNAILSLLMPYILEHHENCFFNSKNALQL